MARAGGSSCFPSLPPQKKPWKDPIPCGNPIEPGDADPAVPLVPGRVSAVSSAPVVLRWPHGGDG